MTEPLSVRDRIKLMQRELMDGKPTPEMTRECLVALTALSGRVADEYRETEIAYKHELLNALRTSDKANRARIEAECTPEYRTYREAKDLLELVKQLVVTCRGYLRSIDQEMHLAR